MADNPWLSGDSAGGGGGNPWLATGPASSTKKTDGHRRFLSLGTLTRLPGDLARDVVDTAEGIPGGIVQAGKAEYSAVKSTVQHPWVSTAQGKEMWAHPLRPVEGTANTPQTAALGQAYVQGLEETAQHPLRKPGTTLLTALPVVGTGGRIALGAKAAAETGSLTEGLAVARHPSFGARTIQVGDSTARGQYSRSVTGALLQKAGDAGIAKLAAAPGKLGELGVNKLDNRFAKWQGRDLRVGDAVARAPGTRLQTLGRKLTAPELRALRIVAEEVPIGRRTAAQELRATQAKSPAEAARHAERIGLNKAAAELLTESSGKPLIRPEHTKLQRVYDAMVKAAGDREKLLGELKLMDEAGAQAAKTKAARLAAGGTYVDPTAARLGKSDALDRAEARVGRLQDRFDKLYETGRGRYETKSTPRTEAEAKQRLSVLEFEHDKAVEVMSRALYGKVDRAESNARTASNRRATRQASGVTRSGLASGASSWKSQVRPTVKEERRRAVEAEIADRFAKNPEHPMLQRWMERADEIDQLRDALNPDIFEKPDPAKLGSTEKITYRGRTGKLDRAGVVLSHAKGEAETQRKRVESRKTPTGVVGADDTTVSPGAPFVGNPVERSKMTGRPKVSSGRTFGHTRKPSSLKTSTGGSLEHALERNDTTNIVAERHAEAVRLNALQRHVDKVKGAGTKAPTRDDDMWVWTDKTVSSKRIPAAVKQYLDRPEAFAALKETEQASVLDKIREAVLEPDWHASPERRAELERAAEKGQGVFVRRRLLGDAADSHTPSTNRKVVKIRNTADAINNVQKAVLVYAKLSYPVVQSVSNAAMNVIQGAASPTHMLRASKTYKAVGPEVTAVAEDIMGQGAIVQAAFEGSGAVAHMTQKVGNFMSRGVDRPARLNAFHYEAEQLGYDTPDKFKALIEDEAHADDLAEAAQRGKEAIVDYGEMSPFEKSIVRRALFVYAWQKGAVKYAGHFVRDHPVQAAVLAQAGPQGKAEADRTFGPHPSYLQGLVGVGRGRGINTAGVNFFETPASQLRALSAPTSGRAQSFLTPALGGIVAGLSGQDSLGRPLPQNPLAAARHVFTENIPAVRAGRAALSDRSSIARSLLGPSAATKTNPNSNDALFMFLLGGLYPRRYDKAALNKNAALENVRR